MKKRVCWALATSALIASSTVSAHSNFVENPVDGSREWLEGTRQFLKLNLAHTCGHGGISEDIKDVKIVFPNGKDQVVTEWQDARGTQQSPPRAVSAAFFGPSTNMRPPTSRLGQAPTAS